MSECSATLKFYRQSLKAYLRDFAGLNRLLRFEEENSSEQLDFYLQMALGTLNSFPPFIASFNFANFPIPSLIVHQASIEGLVSNGISFSRNDLEFSNGGLA